MSFYAEMAQTANDLLSEFGQAVTITHKSSSAYNPATGSVTVSESAEVGIGAVFDYKAQANGQNEINGTLIQQGDKKLLLSSKNISAPVVDDIVFANGLSYTIKNVKDLNPAGMVVLYECLLRL